VGSIRNAKMRKCENAKMAGRRVINAKMRKCENGRGEMRLARTRNREW